MPKKRLKPAEDVMSLEDLLLEVLLRLPARSLIRFTCVSKRWLFLISDPKFGSKHTRLNPTSSTLGVYFNYVYSPSYRLKSVSLHQPNGKDLPILTNTLRDISPNEPTTLHACNGLFLCYYMSKRSYFVCNFTTRAYTIIPQNLLPLSAFGFHDTSAALLVFDPSKSPHFKVVLITTCISTRDTIIQNSEDHKGKTNFSNGSCHQIDIFSSKTRVWERKYFKAPDSAHLEYKFDYKVICNGSIHWITSDRFHVRFEVDTTKLIVNQLPPELNTIVVEHICYFGECRGHLVLIHIPKCNDKGFNILELDKDYISWEVRYCVDMSNLMSYFPRSFKCSDRSWNFSVLCVVKEDETNDVALLLSIPGKIVFYNLNRKTFKVLHELQMHEYPLVSSYNFTYTYPFMATLSPVSFS